MEPFMCAMECVTQCCHESSVYFMKTYEDIIDLSIQATIKALQMIW